jgi:hypothetical protein
LSTFQPQELLKNRSYVSLSSLETSLSSSITSSVTSLTDSRLKISNLLNKDLIFPVDWRNLSESIYFGSAYVRTKVALNNIINNYPIGLSGSSTSTLYLEQIEQANNFIATLNEYDWWVFRQLCGESLSSSSMSFTANATAVRESLSATITPSSPIYSIPVIIRDSDNFLLPPQGVRNKVTLDDYYTDLLEQDPNESLDESYYYSITPFEQILTNAIAFDQGVQFVLRKDWSGTASEKYSFTTYDGILETRYVPEIFKERINRSSNFNTMVPNVLKQDDYHNILERTLESFAQMFDDVKLYMDGLQHLFKNYWAYYDKIPKGYIQQLISHQYGIELFSSENKIIKDELKIRGQYKSQKEITFEFWNRIMCSLVYILKTKGVIESIRAAARSYGFNSNLLQIYELASYNSSIDGYYNATRNYSSGKFRRSGTDSYFTSVSSSLSGITLTSFTIHARTKFINTFSDNVLSGTTGILFSLSPSATVTYQYIRDFQNQSTSGFPFLSFSFNVGNTALTTGYNFITNSNRQSIDGYIDLFFTKDGNNLYASNGYLLSNVDYYNPIITTVSSSNISLSSLSTFTPTSVVVGSLNSANVPEANISHFYIQKVGYNANHLIDITLDSSFMSSPSSYSGTVLAWKFNEYSNLNSSSANYIIDSSINSITGKPTIVYGNKKPYQYIFDAPAFYNDDIPGFKTQKLNSLTGLYSLNVENNIRVGISLAQPINTYIHTIFGSNFGELYANPVDIYSSSGEGAVSYSYSLANDKSNEMFSVINSGRNQIHIAEFLKFLNRISGHLGGFFNFIQQIIPASKDIMEKGIIVENPINNRIILHKSVIKQEHNFTKEDTIDSSESVTTERPLNNQIIINSALTSNTTNNYNFYETVDSAPTLFGNSIIIDSARNATSISALGISSINGALISQYGQNIDGNSDEDVEKINSITSSISAFTLVQNSSDYPLRMIEYIPRQMLNDITKTIYYTTQNKIVNPNTFNNITTISNILPKNIIDNSYFINVVMDDARILLSTSYSALDEEKKLTGIIYVTDKYNRKVQTDANVLRFDLSDCVIDGLNRFRFVIDGEDLPFNEHVKDFPIKNKNGIRFEINIKNAPNDTINSNAECFIFIDNLLNPTQRDGLNTEGRSIQLFIADSMEKFSGTVGYSIKKNR